VDSKDNVHDFFRDSDGTITEFDPASGTFPRVVNPRINSAGTIVSVYATPEGNVGIVPARQLGRLYDSKHGGVASTQAEDLNDLGEVVDLRRLRCSPRLVLPSAGTPAETTAISRSRLER